MIEGWKRSNDGTMVLQHTPLKKPWRLSWSGRISNWLLEDSVSERRKGDLKISDAKILAHYLL